MVSRTLYRFLQLEFRRNPSDQLALFLHFIPYRMDRSTPAPQQRLITLCHLSWKLRKCYTEARFSSETWQLVNTTPPSEASLNPLEDLLFLVFPKIALAAVHSIQVKINYISVLPKSSLSWKKEKILPNLWYTQLQYLLNYTFVFLGSWTDLLSGHLLWVFQELLGLQDKPIMLIIPIIPDSPEPQQFSCSSLRFANITCWKLLLLQLLKF